MLSGSAILRVLLVIVAAAGIAGLIQRVWLRGPAQEAAAPTPPAAVTAAPEPAAPVRTITPAAPARSEAQTAPQPVPAETPQTPAPPPLASAPAAPPAPAPSPAAPADTPPSPPGPVAEPDPVAEAEQNAPPAALPLVDLNTGSLAALNGLKGGGAIGRAIIQHRPYTTVDQLLSKRVLSRATYQRIKDQVTVQ